MNHICRRCRKHDFLLGCKDGYIKNDSQIKSEKYACFQERILKMNKGCKCTDECLDIYGDEDNGSSNKIHRGLMNARRIQLQT
jgi:hypothetical protein